MKDKGSILAAVSNGLLCLLILTYILPSGILGGVPVQRLCIYALLLCAAAAALKENTIGGLIRQFRAEIIVMGAGVLWWAVSFAKGEPYCTRFFSLLYVTLFLFTAVVILLRCGVLRMDAVLLCLLVMLFGKMLEKIGMEIVFLLKLLPYEQVGAFYQTVFGTDVTTMTMDLGAVELIRVQSSSDALVLSLSPFLWFMPQIRRQVRGLLFVLTGVFALIVFSRIYLVQFVCFAGVLAVYYGRKASWKVRACAAGAAALSAVFWLPPALDLIRLRFFSSFVSESDSIRTEQLARFLEAIPQRLFTGHGMGSFLPDYQRSAQYPFSYELEYVSYIYQLGLIGFALIIGGMVFIYVKRIYGYARYNAGILQFVSLLILGWYLIRPVFNPAFLGKQNGFILIGLLLLNAYCQNKKSIVS